MGKGKAEIRVGTSGWYYEHWVERFYPADLKKDNWLDFYCQHFDTVEINNTFYHQPKQSTFENWYQKTPQDFVFVVKASRYITHIKRLKDAGEPVQRFWDGVKLLKDKLGPILFQLPPGFHKDLGRINSFVKLLPRDIKPVFEFRHESWFGDDTYELLNKLNAGFCTHDMPGRVTPRIITSDIIYLRFHGSTGRYQGKYTKAQMSDWAEWIEKNLKNIKAVYAYFNNDYNAYAVYNAKQLKAKLNGLRMCK